jgi:hypothetical protein
MKIVINYHPQLDEYHSKIWDGPDGIYEESFVCRSLGELFEQIIMWRTLIGQQYK